MNTTKKGDKFEDLVYIKIEALLKNRELGLDPDACTIYQKKGYYSALREKDIIVDISIEVFRKGSSEPIMIWVIECKDYGDTISVNEVEEFDTKMTQITGLNTKAIIVSSNAFQRGTLTFARNRHIALVRLLPDNQVTWYSNFDGMPQYPEALNPKLFEDALTIENFQSEGRNFYAFGNRKIFADWIALFRHF